jgi:aminobenzoyl-glutamate utilization protein B
MNVGVNYLREHIIDGARIHYAVTNTGGVAPNVVQAEAEVTYLIRALKPDQVKSLYERVVKCAKGAAMMTETTVDEQIVGSCHNLIPNKTLETIMDQHMNELGYPEVTDEDIRFAKDIFQTLSEEEKGAIALQVGNDFARKLAEKPIADFVIPLAKEPISIGGSTDVADVSWNVPTAQCTTSTWAVGTPFHTWQVVAQGKSNYAHQAMLLAGKTIASTAITAIENPEVIEQAKNELKERLNGEHYVALIPEELMPPKLSVMKKDETYV